MKKFLIPLVTVAMVVSIVFTGCVPGAAPPVTPPVTPPPVTPPVEPVTPPVEPVTPPVVEEERLVFAYILYGDLAHPFLAETAEGFQAACDLFGIDTMVTVAEYDEGKMISLVDAAVAADVDGIFTFCWLDPVSLTAPFQRALDKGINVVHMSAKNPDFTPAEVPHVGFEIWSQGYALGTYWAERLPAEGLATDVHIGTFLTAIDSPLELDRRRGFLDALADAGIEYTTSDPQPTDPSQTVCMDQIKAYLLANPETNLIFGSGGTTTAACFQALEALGFAPGEVWVAGMDLLPEAVVGVRAGYGACNQDEVFPYGFLGATALYLRIEHGLIIGDLPITTYMVDQTNVDKYFGETPPVVEEERLVFAYILYGDLAHPFLAETAEGFQAACDLFGIDTMVTVAEYDEGKMISLVDAAVAADVDGIFTFCWLDPVSLTAPFQRALDKGINVVHMSAKNPDFTPAEVPHVGFEIWSQGYALGTYWAERLPAEGLATDVHIGTFLTAIDSPLELDRRRGFLDALADAGIEYTTSDPQPTDPSQTVCMDQIKAYLLANPETNLIFGSGGTTTAACFQALEALGFAPGEVWVAGMDLLPEAVVGVRAGYGACNQDEVFPYGFLGATALYLRIEHGLIIGDLPITTYMVDQTNVDEYFD